MTDIELEINSYKSALLESMSPLYLFPEFTIENATESPELIVPFYDLAIELTQKYSVNERSIDHYITNFTMENSHPKSVKNLDELVNFLELQKSNFKRNDSRFTLGFRSIWFIINENLSIITLEDIASFNKKLKPFYKYYAHPNRLVFGCGV